MPLYEYKGILKNGKATNGTIEADSAKTARLKLKQLGVIITSMNESSSKTKKSIINVSSIGNIKQKYIVTMTRQLATLIKARIPLNEALGSLIEQTEDKKLKNVLSQVRESVNQGKSLAASCRLFPKVFSPIFISMIQVGEASGNLDLVLSRLANFAESQQNLRQKVIGAMVYPAFMFIAGTGITIFLFAFAIPKITEVFAGSKMPLPILTKIMINISEFFASHWLIVAIGIFGFISFFKWYTNTTNGRNWWDAISLKIPAFGELKRMVAISRFARTMATLVGSGVPVLDAIDIVKDVVDNAVIRNALIKSRESISEGKTIAGPLKASGEFPPVLTHMVAVGEKTGELEEVLNVVSDSYDSQVDTAIQSMTRLLEPLMIVILGGIIALVALSIFMPMLQLNSLTNLGG